MDKSKGIDKKYKRLAGMGLTVALLLLIPLIVMQFANEVDWTLLDFVVAMFLLLGAGLLFELVIRKINNTTYRIIALVVLFSALFFIWAELAVGIFGAPFSGF
jgi:Flp pilus assembly protein TadB